MWAQGEDSKCTPLHSHLKPDGTTCLPHAQAARPTTCFVNASSAAPSTAGWQTKHRSVRGNIALTFLSCLPKH